MILLSSLVYGAPYSAEDIIEKALEHHQVSRSIQEIEMTLTAKKMVQSKVAHSENGKLLRAEDVLYSKITFTAPSDIAGTVMIVADHPDQEDPQLLYLPALQRTQRIAGRARKGAFMGSDFQYSDLEYSVDGAIEHKLINESDAHWVIATTLPKGEAYPFRESTILKDLHMLSKMQYFDADRTLQKTYSK